MSPFCKISITRFRLECMKTIVFLSIFILFNLVVYSSGLASGYKIGAESVSDLGRAGAGGAALAGDASINHSNPAGLVRLNRREWILGGTYVHPDVAFEPADSNFFDGSILSGSNGGNAGTPAFVPNMHVAMPVNDKFAVGASITSQYGLVTDYHPQFIGRYDLVNASLFGVNFNPSAAWKISEKVAIGFGLNVAYGRQKLRQAVDFGSVCGVALGRSTCDEVFDLVPGQSDGLARVRIDDWAMGFNLGALYDINKATRVGIAYRSRLKFDGQGHARNQFPEEVQRFLLATGTAPAFTNSNASGQFYFPASGELSVSHILNDRVILLATLGWIDWSVVKESRIQFENPFAIDSVSRVDYRDSYQFSAGLDYKASDSVIIRGGVALQQSPVRDSFREPSVPDADRIIIAIGASYRYKLGIILDLGYQFHNLTDGPQDRTAVTGSRTRGNYDVTSHFLGVGLRLKF